MAQADLAYDSSRVAVIVLDLGDSIGITATHSVPSTRFLFWNINRKPLAEAVADLANADQIDVVILVECEMEPNSVLSALNGGWQGGFHFPPGECAAVRVFTRFSRDFLTPVDESERVSIRRLDLPARNQIVLAVAHLPSKLYSSDDSQGMSALN